MLMIMRREDGPVQMLVPYVTVFGGVRIYTRSIR